jgi:hypothetical protein
LAEGCYQLRERLDDVLRNGLKALIHAMDKRNYSHRQKDQADRFGPQLIPVASFTGLAVSSRRPYRELSTSPAALSPPVYGGTGRTLLPRFFQGASQGGFVRRLAPF